jgi:hypothetical protein
MNEVHPTAIFVFGSNLAGRHGKGAALFAKRHYGAIQGQGIGLQGRSYAIPTKDYHLQPLPLTVIHKFCMTFWLFASANRNMEFLITPVGCGLAGYRSQREEIRRFFEPLLPNCTYSREWEE